MTKFIPFVTVRNNKLIQLIYKFTPSSTIEAMPFHTFAIPVFTSSQCFINNLLIAISPVIPNITHPMGPVKAPNTVPRVGIIVVRVVIPDTIKGSAIIIGPSTVASTPTTPATVTIVLVRAGFCFIHSVTC